MTYNKSPISSNDTGTLVKFNFITSNIIARYYFKTRSIFRLASKYISLTLIKYRCRSKNKELTPIPGEHMIPPGVSSPTFNGFVTSKHNEDGMQADFLKNTLGGVCCHWRSTKKYEGFPQALHGGITIALLDELSAYAVFDKYNTYSLTLSCNIKWKGKATIDTEIKAKAEVVNKLGRLIEVKSILFNHKNRVVVEMHSIFFIPTKKQFKKFIDLSIMPKEAIPFCGADSI